MINVHENGARHNAARTLLPALLIPETGTALHTILAPAGVKTVASVHMRTGSGLRRKARRVAVNAHDVCQIFVHSDIPEPDGLIPVPEDFHAPTLLWAIENSAQIALWTEPGESQYAEVGAWLVNTAHSGSRFQTCINATLARTPSWLAFVETWKSDRAEVRVFDGETLQ